MIVITIVAAWLLADFIGGIFHWYQDLYMSRGSKFWFIRNLANDSFWHHQQPWNMSKKSKLENVNTSIPLLPFSVILYLVGAPTVVWLAAFFACFSNFIHSYTHDGKRSPKLVNWLQAIGIWQSDVHHEKHHYLSAGPIGKVDSHARYCVMTNYLNPILDGMRFFVVLEIMFRLIGIRTIKGSND